MERICLRSLGMVYAIRDSWAGPALGQVGLSGIMSSDHILQTSKSVLWFHSWVFINTAGETSIAISLKVQLQLDFPSLPCEWKLVLSALWIQFGPELPEHFQLGVFSILGRMLFKLLTTLSVWACKPLDLIFKFLQILLLVELNRTTYSWIPWVLHSTVLSANNVRQFIDYKQYAQEGLCIMRGYALCNQHSQCPWLLLLLNILIWKMRITKHCTLKRS